MARKIYTPDRIIGGLPQEAVPVSKLESGAHSPASELAEAERKPG